MKSIGLVILACLTLSLGCQCGTAPATRPVANSALTTPAPNPDINAIVAPPAGWKPEPLEVGKDYKQQVWLSPTGNTAYGIIHFGIPLPMPANWLLKPFLDNMKKSEGEANLIGQPVHDDTLPGLRFTVEGGRYKMRINLITRGFKAWAVFSGTLRTQPEAAAERELADRAKEQTRVGGQ